MNGTTCRDELLIAVRTIVKNKGINEFTVKEAIDYMKANGTVYKESTISTHIRAKCCIDTNKNHGTVFNDYRNLGNGKFELVNV